MKCEKSFIDLVRELSAILTPAFVSKIMCLKEYIAPPSSGCCGGGSSHHSRVVSGCGSIDPCANMPIEYKLAINALGNVAEAGFRRLQQQDMITSIRRDIGGCTFL